MTSNNLGQLQEIQ